MTTYTGITQDLQDTKNQIGVSSDTFTVPISFQENIGIRSLFAKQFLVGLGDSFVLGSATNGVLGSIALGDRRVEILNGVYPYNDIIEEDFIDDSYIDTDNSDGTIDTALETYSLTTGQTLLSKVVCKTGSPINNAKLSSLVYTGDEPVVELSNDGGTTFSTVTLNTLHNFSASQESDELVYRVTVTGSTVIESPFKIQVNKG